MKLEDFIARGYHKKLLGHYDTVELLVDTEVCPKGTVFTQISDDQYKATEIGGSRFYLILPKAHVDKMVALGVAKRIKS